MHAEASTASSIASRVSKWPDGSVPGLRVLRQEVSRELRAEPGQFVIDVGLRLIANAALPKWFTYELLNHHPEALSHLTREHVETFGQGVASWGEVDAFACYISGPAWRENRLATTDIKRWAKSPDRWWRRAALVSTVPLNSTARGGSGDAKRTLLVCEILKDDRDDMVVKALSWALRELTKKQPAAVKLYLAKQEVRLAPRVIREVRNKLTTGLKTPKTRRKLTSGRKQGTSRL